MSEFDPLIKALEALRSDPRIIKTALSSVLPQHKNRIFKSGFDSNGAQIGTYSTKPASISRKQQARQTGRTYFKGGYSEYKSAIGKNPGYVNLRNTDQMMMDYGLIQMGGSTFGFGFQNESNFKKSQWAELKYKKSIFAISKSEQDLIAKVLAEEIKRAFNQ
jgi:hypothetical protein